jgi:hypothetical protein
MQSLFKAAKTSSNIPSISSLDAIILERTTHESI